MQLATDCKYYTGKGRCSHPLSGRPREAACVGYGKCYAYERRSTMDRKDCKFCTDAGVCSSIKVNSTYCHNEIDCKVYERRKTMQKFWMLLVDGASYPTRQHFSINDAIVEAGRLLNLKENWGKGITLLEAVDRGRLGHTPVTYPVIWAGRTGDVFEFPEDFGE